MARPPLPPFTHETAVQKVRMAEDAWNTRDPERVALAHSEDSQWRNRAEFFSGLDRVHPDAATLRDRL
jgi:nuclear transport factor 2 (NTF2) superfamily protein